MEKTQPLQQLVLGKLDSHMSNNEIRTFLHTIYKKKTKQKNQNNSKWFKDLNVRSETTKLLEENKSMFFDIGLSNIFLDHSP